MDKIQLVEIYEEQRVYYIDRETGEFYITHVKHKYSLPLLVGIVMILSLILRPFIREIDYFYIPRSNPLSNGLLLAILFVAIVVFHVKIKKRLRKKLAALKPQPISLDVKKEIELLRKTKFGCKLVLVFIAMTFPAACILAFFFWQTSEAIFFVSTGTALVIFAAVAPLTKYVIIRLKVANKWLKAY